MRRLPKKGRPRIEDRAKTIEARKPWLKLEMSRRTWYRRQAEKRDCPQGATEMSAMGLRYGIPPDVEADIWARDVCCVYCGKAMDPKSSNRADHPSIEHLMPTAQHVYVKTAAYFAIACFGCNSSRRDKPLARWLRVKGFADTAAPVVKDYAKRPEASLEIDPAALAQDRRNAKAKELQPAVG